MGGHGKVPTCLGMTQLKGERTTARVISRTLRITKRKRNIGAITQRPTARRSTRQRKGGVVVELRILLPPNAARCAENTVETTTRANLKTRLTIRRTLYTRRNIERSSRLRFLPHTERFALAVARRCRNFSRLTISMAAAASILGSVELREFTSTSSVKDSRSTSTESYA
jgi:hypothetical protein